MRAYELLLLIRFNPDEAAINQVTEQVTDLVEAKGGQILKTNVWGKRKLAYPIDNQSNGFYILLNLAVAPSALKDIEFEMKLNENLLRYLFVKDETIDLPESQADASEEAASEEPVSEEAEEESAAEEDAASPEEDASAEESAEPTATDDE
ncbi:MAG TPA: 30S ribosomal protein S6 [Chloroflexi bacterium]|nr:MAG: 30S ribosomal protein S6 [Anaerolineaceae bacterium 4572_5.2]HEY85918.1 30S ribosomal protein S6 [Chloroflexota bacterium]